MQEMQILNYGCVVPLNMISNLSVFYRIVYINVDVGINPYSAE